MRGTSATPRKNPADNEAEAGMVSAGKQKEQKMGYIIAPNPLATDGEFESIDAAIAAIKKYAGLYPNCVKVEKRYRTENRGEIAFVSFLGERFAVRERYLEAQKPQKLRKSQKAIKPKPKTTDAERDERARAILAAAVNTQRGGIPYTIWERRHSTAEKEDYRCFMWDVFRTTDLRFGRFEGDYLPTRDLAKLVLAWHSMALLSESGTKNAEYLRRTFDETLRTGRFGDSHRYFVGQVDIDRDLYPEISHEEWYDEEVVDASKMSFPPFAEGLENIIEKCW